MLCVDHNIDHHPLKTINYHESRNSFVNDNRHIGYNNVTKRKPISCADHDNYELINFVRQTIYSCLTTTTTASTTTTACTTNFTFTTTFFSTTTTPVTTAVSTAIISTNTDYEHQHLHHDRDQHNDFMVIIRRVFFSLLKEPQPLALSKQNRLIL